MMSGRFQILWLLHILRTHKCIREESHHNVLIASLQWPPHCRPGLSISGHLGSPEVQLCLHSPMRPSSMPGHWFLLGFYALWVWSVKPWGEWTVLYFGVTIISFLSLVPCLLKYWLPLNTVSPPNFIVIPSGRVSKIGATITDIRKRFNYSLLTLWCNMFIIFPRKLNGKLPCICWTMDKLLL